MSTLLETIRRTAISPTVDGRRVSTLGRWPEVLTLAAYIALLASVIPFHEPWADEAQAWQLARSVSVLDLLSHYLRYEGSPGLWHLLLAMLAKMHVTYEGIHWVSGLIAVGASSLLIFLRQCE
jgi:hypothetical protein